MFLNKFTITGIVIIILGIFLTPIFIGFPIMVVGFLIGDFGIIYGIVRHVPGLEDKFKKLFAVIKNSYKPYFRKVVNKK
ncbi:MAG TPA: hypothetical protein VMR19_03120 [Candidatus Saccharimonadales bacterium]|jgi:hypothetical protein|nr:hypothetical protein [Candidatus Saccharimonadales bacterium]